jgi:hypothetical protein
LFCYPRFLFFHMRFRIALPCLWRIVLEFWWELHWICRLLLSRLSIFTMLILPIYEHGRSFHLLRSSSISFIGDLILVIQIFHLLG